MNHTAQPKSSELSVGIDAISFSTSHSYIDLATLAKRKEVEVSKYYNSLGQEKMGIPSHDEDIVTLAAEAAARIMDTMSEKEKASIRSILFATETAIDQSKAAGIYVHELLGLGSHCRVVELKQACYAATAALQMACGLIARDPEARVLVIAADVAKYDLDSAAEITQGAGAAAMMVSANPRIMHIDACSGLYTEDVMDFWRPNNRKTPIVDGRFSATMYMKALKGAWDDYQKQGGHSFDELEAILYHLPFTRMGVQAQRSLFKHVDKNSEHTSTTQARKQELFERSTIYGRQIGNSYTASLYIGLCSLLDSLKADGQGLEAKAIGLFSYGSGCVGEFFVGHLVQGYAEHLFSSVHREQLESRKELGYERYLHYWREPELGPDGSCVMHEQSQRAYRLRAVIDNKRDYVRQ